MNNDEIQTLIDARYDKMLIADLEKLKDQLAAAKAQLEKQVDEMDTTIAEKQANSLPDQDLIEQQQPFMELLEEVTDAFEAVEERIHETQWIVIDGEIIDVDHVSDANDECPAMIDEGRRDWYVDEDAETAGVRARERWKNMAENDPKEFVCMVGEETLIKWGMGHYAGPGSTQVRSLEEWLDLHLNAPEEEFASYDGAERDVDFCSETLVEELGFTPTVAYRHN